MESKLTNKDTLSPTAVETVVCDLMNSKPKNRPMSKEDMALLIQLNSFEMGIDQDNDGAVDDLYQKLNQASLPMKVFEARLSKMGIEMTSGVKIMMGCLMETPGTSVLYVCYFLKWCKDNKTTKISLDDWCTKMFPMGVFSEEVLHEVWDAQKVKRATDEVSSPDNLVDYSTAFISLVPVKEEITDEES